MKIFGRDRPRAAAIERELSATAATLGGHLHHAPSDYAGPIPTPWEPVLAARSASERVRHALAMWAQLAPQLPESRSLLSQHCRDVRLCSLHGAPALAYVITHAETIHVVVAEAPAGPRVDPPEAWATVPELLRTFLSEVHGSLTDRWNTATIPVAPEEMESLDTWGHGAFDPEHLLHAGLDLTPDELTLFVDASGNGRYLCISPRLPGQVLWWDIYEGVEVADLWGAVDGTLATLLQPR